MPQIVSSNNKRIAKNTIILYIRTFFILIISLFTSRIVLSALGVEDYGTYNVVGGFVTMFSLLSASLSNAISRYITFELGRGDSEKLSEVFSNSVNVQIILATIIFFIAEIVGVWFLNVKMNIPEGRMIAANWAFQCSLLTFVINLISVPYNACIIAHEHMNAFAFVSILESLLKLGSVVVLFIIGFDRLIVYAILLVLVALLIRLIYGIYCSRHFEECHYKFILNNKLVKEMTSLASWNMLGSSGAVLNAHGVNLLMNMFFGVTVNAARGLAVQVNAAVTQFVSSFTVAVNPQITKSYAQGNKEESFRLVMKSSKYSFYLMLIFAVPLIAETPFLLKLWLNIVPDYTIVFVRLTLIISLITTLSTSLYTLALATGNIRNYQIIVGSLSLSCFFITYAFYKIGFPVEWAYYVSIIINIAIMFARLIILSKLTELNIAKYSREVLVRTIIVSTVITVPIILCCNLLPEESFIHFILIVCACIIITVLTILLVGLAPSERTQLWLLIKRNH